MPPGDKAFTIPSEVNEDLTLPKVLINTAKRYGDSKAAMREKEFGVWRPITWKKYLENVKNIALGLVSLGLKRGDKVAMIGDNRPEGLWMEMATLSVGGIAVWLFQDSLMDEVAHIINHSDAAFLVGEGQEEVDKALSVQGKCPFLKKIIWDDPKGMRDYNDPMLIGLKEVMEKGRELDQKDPDLFEQIVSLGKAGDVA
jgi:long-chain acyl-CoA synthetase